MTIPIRAEKKPRYETFRLWARAWDIEKAKALLKKKPRKPVEGDLSGWWDWIGEPDKADRIETKPDGTKVTYMKINMVYVDWKYVKTIKPKRAREPIIMATLPDPKGGKPMNLIIDGWHRLGKARIDGRKKIKVYLLTVEETKEIELA